MNLLSWDKSPASSFTGIMDISAGKRVLPTELLPFREFILADKGGKLYKFNILIITIININYHFRCIWTDMSSWILLENTWKLY